MNFPFVSRTVYDDVRADLAAEKSEVRRLTQTIIDMKVTGATIRQATNTALGLVRTDRKEPSKLDLALDANARTRTNRSLAGKMREWAERQIAAGENEDEVFDRVQNWNRVTDDDDTDDEAASA